MRLRGSEAAIAAAVVIEGAALSFLSPHFLTAENLLNVSLQASITAIVAAGMTFVILTGGIDLSVGSVVAVAGIATTAALAGGHAYATAIAAGLGIGLVSGVVAGALVTRLGVAPFIVTLALMTIERGLAFVATEGRPVWDLPPGFAGLGGGRLAGVPFPSIVMVLVFVVAHAALKHTRWGRHVYAVGGNAEAARLAGIGTARVVASTYVLCGGLAALGGVLLASRMNSGQPNAGLMLELDVIAAVVVGGTSLSGGRGSVAGTFLGTMLIAILRNGLNLLNVNSYVQQVVVGAVILLAVLLDRLRERRT
ncbi:MAG TPA: ABC transporter permease [Candidatus Polarisedimenticolaceae bacterium]|nr:ABC transporter permease [Candidatus Polarisedimenticolaceae bacterium]